MATVEKIYANQELVARLEQVAKDILGIKESIDTVHRLPVAIRQVLVDKLVEFGQEGAKPFFDEDVCALLINAGRHQEMLIPEVLVVTEDSVSMHCARLSYEKIVELLSAISSPETITSIDLSRCRNLEGLDWLKRFSQVIHVNLQKTNIKDLIGIGECKQLESLDISDCKELVTLNGLGGQALKVLYADGCSKLQDISALRGMAVTSANFSHCRDIKNFDPIEELAESLAELKIEYCPRFNKKSIVNSLVHLKLSSFEHSGVSL